MVTWTRVKFPNAPSKSAFKKTRKKLRVVFKEPPSRSKRIYQYLVVKPIKEVTVAAADIDPDDRESTDPRHFSLIPGMRLTSRLNISKGNSIGYITFGLTHRAKENHRIRTYTVKVHADTIGHEIIPLPQLVSRPPAGSVAPEHPSRIHEGEGEGEGGRSHYYGRPRGGRRTVKNRI